MSTLRKGSRGSSVRDLQYLLNMNLNPDPNLIVDGKFGNGTYEALKRFQAQEGLENDGVAGDKTWAELGDLGVEEAPQCGGIIPVWMHMAISELNLGVREKAGAAHNSRILEYHQATNHGATRDENAWCSSFANWCIQRSGLSGTRKANARSWLGWGTELNKPRYGCVTVLWRESKNSWKGHVGFYIGHRDTNNILLLGGNQGNAVKIASYKASRLLSYRWPADRA